MATIVATPSEVYAGVSLQIQFAASVTKCRVGRMDPSGFVSLIRSGDTIDLSAGAAVVWDYEAPLDVEIYYTAEQVAPVGSEKGTSNPVTIPSGGYSWLKDPGYPTRNMRLNIVTSIVDLTTAARAGVFPIINRANPVVISAVRQSATGELMVHTLTDAEREAMTTLLSRGGVLLFQTPKDYGWGSKYIHIADVVEARIGLVMEPSRRWSLPFQITDRPEGLAQAGPGVRWSDTRSTYAMWQALKDTGKTWEKLVIP